MSSPIQQQQQLGRRVRSHATSIRSDYNQRDSSSKVDSLLHHWESKKKKEEVFLISDVFCWLIRFLFASQSFALLSLVDDVIRVARRPLPSLVELPQIERRT